MTLGSETDLQGRYRDAKLEKLAGATYTPKLLADFVAEAMVEAYGPILRSRNRIRIMDPAVGHGQLLISLLEVLLREFDGEVDVCGYETDIEALTVAKRTLADRFPNVHLVLHPEDFLEASMEHSSAFDNNTLFQDSDNLAFDLIIANPPYVRTQMLGKERASQLRNFFQLSGRVDLSHAFVVAMSRVLAGDGVLGLIISNSFMTTKSGAPVRSAIRERFRIRQVWDLGDTKLFDAAVLPSVIILSGRMGDQLPAPSFGSIYEVKGTSRISAKDPLDAVRKAGIVEVPDGRCFSVKHGQLNTPDAPDCVWRLTDEHVDEWIRKVNSHTWKRFSDVGAIRVGVKTCADSVFIKSDWRVLPADQRPELLKPLTTHRVARRFRALEGDCRFEILYPHETRDGTRKPIDLEQYPNSRAYLERHRQQLEKRQYLIDAGRQWYEIWVPQDPTAWPKPKLVFRDISEHPVFWLDLDGTIVNGDCYWMICHEPEDADLLWLAAAVANSTFTEAFYDHCFHNRLYAGRRRFITQYVEQFPLPNPNSDAGREIIARAKQTYDEVGGSAADALMSQLDALIWKAFGLSPQQIGW